jgi:hypothetical protein
MRPNPDPRGKEAVPTHNAQHLSHLRYPDGPLARAPSKSTTTHAATALFWIAGLLLVLMLIIKQRKKVRVRVRVRGQPQETGGAEGVRERVRIWKWVRSECVVYCLLRSCRSTCSMFDGAP